MRTTLTTVFIAAATAAHAHPGHIAAQDGHTHFAAIGAAVVAGAIVAALAAGPRLLRRMRTVRDRRNHAG